ncbi:arginine--tRNA ligase [Nocardia yamanashiensis]|uniref:arginine--tRNA ligase n=1 Tax=Nocardia yamanashiensis TaxID=209247 RepID=UPI001E3420DA|nr:arginine--tRNA ligase [Nocardia yamanashiensis]UGT41557.1 arginine--tRNA ligase [Nocardia yamanashiensis]
MKTLEQVLRERLARAFAEVGGEDADPVVQRSQRADFQANGALALGKRLGMAPREVAGRVLAAAELDDLAGAVEVSGPGFINMTVDDAVLGRLVGAVNADVRLGVPAAVRPETVVVDYSAPNVAKEMHVGHLRSTVIGDAAVRVLEWAGHRVIRRNHLGDWGTPFGMLIEHMADIGDAEAVRELSVGDLSGFYTAARKKFDADDGFKERARLRVVALQGGDAATLRLWRLLVVESKRYFGTVYEQLGVRLTEADFVGESAYNDRLGAVVDDLERLGLLAVSAGAQCVFPDGFTGRDGQPLPLIVRKSDGGFGYAATDLAAIRNRVEDLEATRLLYVVGSPQAQHFGMVFATARAAGWLADPARAEHIGFGSVLGGDGKVLRSRAGGTVKLVELLAEARQRAAAVVAAKSPELSAAEQAEVAAQVGIGAVKYADLSTDRTRDYVFDFDRMLGLEGNTGPYLQYAHARTRSLFRKSGGEPVRDGAPVIVAAAAERALALELLAFPDVFADVVESLAFHRLAGYLFGVASAFAAFYERCPILKAPDPDVRASRLALTDLTGRTLSAGLGMLGIGAPDRM